MCVCVRVRACACVCMFMYMYMNYVHIFVHVHVFYIKKFVHVCIRMCVCVSDVHFHKGFRNTKCVSYVQSGEGTTLNSSLGTKGTRAHPKVTSTNAIWRGKDLKLFLGNPGLTKSHDAEKTHKKAFPQEPPFFANLHLALAKNHKKNIHSRDINR